MHKAADTTFSSPDDIEDRFSNWKDLAEHGSFEDSMLALESIVAVLESGNLPLETTVRCFEAGTALSARCSELLESARVRVESLADRDLEVDV